MKLLQEFQAAAKELVDGLAGFDLWQAAGAEGWIAGPARFSVAAL